MSLQIKEGAWYRQRDGKVVGPVTSNRNDKYPWRIPKIGSYSQSGLYWRGFESPNDLVEEVLPPVAEAKETKMSLKLFFAVSLLAVTLVACGTDPDVGGECVRGKRRGPKKKPTPTPTATPTPEITTTPTPDTPTATPETPETPEPTQTPTPTSTTTPSAPSSDVSTPVSTGGAPVEDFETAGGEERCWP